VSLPDFSLNLVDSVESAGRFLTWLGERRPVLAIDTETTGVGWTDTVRLVQFGDGAGGWAVPIRNWRGVAEAGLAAVAEGRDTVVMHNAQFDQHKLDNDGFPTPRWSTVEDTLILSRLKDPHLPAGLKPLCSRVFGSESVAGQALLSEQMRTNHWTWATVPDDLPAYWAYGVLDTCLTALAYDHLLPQVPRAAYDREMAVLEIMYGAEKRGMKIDVAYTEALRDEWRAEAAELRSHLQAKGIQNPGSSHQVTLHLKEAGWVPSEFTDTGLPKLDKTVLASLTEHYGDVAEPLVRYRRLNDWCSTYLDTFLRDRDAEDRVHASINTMGARTGRMSITNPPLQTLPSKEASIRNCIIPYNEDEVLYAIDFSQIEMRMLAHYSGDDALIAAVEAEDLHRFCASLAYGVDEADVTDLQRKIAKNTNFARVYGAGPQKIADTAGVPLAQIQGYMDAFDSRFPDVSKFMNSVTFEGKRRLATEGQAYITTSGGRRVVGDPDKVFALTNYVLQGSACDVFKQAIVSVDSTDGLRGTIVGPIHDELLFSFPKATAEAQAQAALDAMQDLTGFRVPMRCEVTGPLTRWGSAYA
jgi:DNA polymerase-1